MCCCCKHSRWCACALCVLMFSSAIFVTCATWVYIYNYKQYEDVRPGTCTAVFSYYRDDYYPSCSCGEECQVTFNCLIIEVNLDKSGPPDQYSYSYSDTQYNTTRQPKLADSLARITNRTKFIERQNYNFTNTTLILFEDESLSSCTFLPRCADSKAEVNAKVEHFNETYGIPGTVFRCLFSPSRPDKVLINFSDEKWYIYQIVVAVCLLVGFSLGFFMTVRAIEMRKVPIRTEVIVRNRQENQGTVTEMQQLRNDPGPSRGAAAQIHDQNNLNELHAGKYAQNYQPSQSQIVSGTGQYPPPVGQYPPPGGQHPLPSAPFEPPPPYAPSGCLYPDDPPPYKA